MKIKIGCGIGYHGAEHHAKVEIDDTELEGKTEDEIDEYINEEYVMPFAYDHLEVWYEILERESD